MRARAGSVAALGLAHLALVALAGPSAARVPLPGGRVTVTTPPGEVGALARAAVARAAAAPRLVGPGGALRVAARSGEARTWVVEVGGALDGGRVAAALRAEARLGLAATDPGLFADLDAVRVAGDGDRLVLRFAAPVCSPSARLAAWVPAPGGLGGAPGPFRPRHAGSFARSTRGPGAHLDRLEVTAAGGGSAPRRDEIALVLRGGRTSGLYLCRLLASASPEAGGAGRLAAVRRLLDGAAFAPLAPAGARVRFTDLGASGESNPAADLSDDPADTLAGVRVAVAVHRAGDDGTDARELSELVARRARVLLAAAGAEVTGTADARAAEITLSVVSLVVLAFGPAEEAILLGHARLAGTAWTVLALGLDAVHGADVGGELRRPETLWLRGPIPER